MRRPYRLASKILLAAGCCAAIASPALAQTTTNADIALTPTIASDPIDTSTKVAVKVTVANNGPSNATGVVISGATFPAQFQLASVSGCTPNDTSATALPLPCTVDDSGLGAGVVPEGTSAKVTITLSFTKDAAKAINEATTCPDGASLGNVTVNVTTTNTDPNAANNTSTAALPGIAQDADLSIATTGPETANEGDTVEFATTVKNNGPCVAPAVTVSTDTNMLDFVDGTAPCATEKTCSLGDMAVGQTVTFKRHYKVAPPPGASAADGAYAHTTQLDVSSNDITDDAGNTTTPAAWDPNGDNNSARPVVTANHAAGGCGTGGRGVDLAALAAIPALLLFARAQRRRAAAHRA